MRKFLALLLSCLFSVVAADDGKIDVLENYEHTMVYFPEPVVSRAMVEADEDASPQDRGIDSFRIEGDARHTPRAVWKDQDRLQLEFLPGTSSKTTYRLVFNNDARYLSGTPITPKQIHFRQRKEKLTGKAYPDPLGAAVLVTGSHQVSRESRTLSSSSKVNFEFRRVKNSFWTGREYYGRRVAACVVPARVADGVMRESVKLLESLGESAWKGLKPDSHLPGHVLVRPAEKLPEGEKWALYCTGGEGFEEWEVTTFCPEYELLSGLEVAPLRAGAKEVELQLYFSHPVRQEELRKLFSRLSFRVAGQGTVNTSKDGGNRRLLLPDGRWLNFRYDGVLPCIHRGAKPSTGAGNLVFTGGNTLADGIRMCVSGHLSVLVDIAVPQGTAAANGLSTSRENVHRIALNPAWPQLLSGNKHAAVLPLHGEHKLRLPTTNLSAVNVTLHRVARQHMVDTYFGSPYDSRAYRNASYKYTVEDERDSADLTESASPERKQRNRKLQALVYAKRERERRMEGALHYPTRRYEMKQEGLLRSSELVLDMDALAGEKLQPGVYILTLHTCPNAHVRNALVLNAAKPDALNYEVDVPVLVTDINLTCSRRGVLATSFADGSLLKDCHLTQQMWNDEKHRWDEKNTVLPRGVAYMDAVGQNVIVRKGQDMAMARMQADYSTIPSPHGEADKESTGCYLFAERSIYRPGDTVRLRGFLRRTREDKLMLPPRTKVKLRVRKPDYSTCCEQELSVDDYGAIATEVKLPDGEEDVVGTYSFDVAADGGEYHAEMSVNCQVFRRDAFEASLRAELAKVAPEKLTLRVQADDYSGVPLANGRVELKVEEDTHRLVTDAAGTATLELPMKPEWLQEGELHVEGCVCNGREEYVVLPAQKLSFSMADFRVRCEEGRLYLTDAQTGAPLGREQQVSVRLWSAENLPENARSLFSCLKERESTLAEQVLTVPADCREGMPLPPQLLPLLDGFRYTITGLDAAGRAAVCRCDAERKANCGTELRLVAQQAGQNIQLQFISPRAGMAHIFIGCGRQLRHVQQAVQKGEQMLSIPLRERESGTVSASLVLVDGDSPQTDCDTAICFVSLPRHHLDVSLQMPQGVVRPGQKVQLSGRVQAGGKASVAVVTLYAVDAGMLSVSEYKRPYPEEYFYNRSAWTFEPIDSNGGWNVAEPMAGVEHFHGSTLSAVWRGELADGRREFLYYRPQEPQAKGIEYGLMTGGLRSGSGLLGGESMDSLVLDFDVADGEMPPWLIDDVDDDDIQMCCPAPEPAPAPCIADAPADNPEMRLRSNFEPVAVWKAALRTDAEGRFSAEAELPDTLTTYRVFAVAADRSGARFGVAEDSFVVNLPVMISPGMPLFMSTGDTLRLPLSITNATEEPGTWSVTMSGCDTPQQIELPAGGSGTLYFEVNPTQEGECTLTWQAVGKPGTDAVQGCCKVRFPAPLLKEVHHPELAVGEAPMRLASLFAPEVAQSGRAQVQVLLSANPLLHLSGALDFLLEYPYGCTEQRASALLPWLLYDELAPFCPKMASTPREKVQEVVSREINALFARQCEDGGLGYWEKTDVACSWASAYAALAFTVARERGFEVPSDKMKRLLDYVDELDEKTLLWNAELMAARALGDTATLRKHLQKIDKYQREMEEQHKIRPAVYGANVRFLLALLNGDNSDAAFRTWLRTVGQDYRHASTHFSALTLLALHDYLRQRRVGEVSADVRLQDGTMLHLATSPVELLLPKGMRPGELPTTLSVTKGKAYALVRAKAQPDRTDYPGVTEKGLQVTRLYEVKGEDGVWRKAPEELKVGDVVRVTLTCAKMADELQYLVLEDYLPACMEAINPDVPAQSAGLESCSWSACFDHREYLADRVRGFCSRWIGRDLLNMTYYARVKRAGTATAPPAQAQLMYEPQVYGLSPNTRVKAR